MTHKAHKIELKADKNYLWCTCGLSKRLPFCDGRHSDSGMRPMIFSVSETKEYHLCTCQLTNNPPFCDKTEK
jgi:CDGSH-type Zn-finger protein